MIERNMVTYSLKQKIFIVKKFYQNGNSIEKVKIEFPSEFKKTKSPADSVIVELVQLFEKFGSVIKNVEKKINQSTNNLRNTGTANKINCLDIHENGKWDLFTEKDIAGIKSEPELFFCTETVDATIITDTENRCQLLVTNENSLDGEHFTQYNCKNDTDDEESNLKPLNEHRSEKISSKSILNAETIEFKENKDGQFKELVFDSDKIDDTPINSNEFINKIEALDTLKTKSKSKTKEKSLLSIKILKCEECNKEFNRKRDYLRHITTHGNSCEICGIKYRDYQIHMSKHTGEKLHQCNKCEAQFVDKTRLKAHMTTHSTDCPFECDLCKKAFKTRDYLRRHIKTHLKDRPYKCEICGKGFLHNNDLGNHSRTHTGEKPFVCSFCGKCFATNNALIVHNRIHTGEAPYKCNICHKQFNVAATLKMHKRIHTGEKPYKCKFCEKAFCDNSTRRTHERTHTGDYPYKCVLCGKAHNHPSNLKSHMRHAHREEQ